VETEEELGIFQLLDRLEEVTSMLTSRWQESMGSLDVITVFMLNSLFLLKWNTSSFKHYFITS
jgi:hypothetical protein